MNLDRQTQARLWLDVARLALDADQLDVAAKCLDRGTRLNPDEPEARLTEAQLHLRLRQPQRALAALDAHDQAHPERRTLPAVEMLRATALVAADEHDLARTLLEDLADAYPADERPARLLAAMSVEIKDAEESIAALRHLVKLRPNDPAARRTLAAQLAEDDPNDALNVLTDSSVTLTDATTRLQLARLYRQTDRLLEAEEVYAALLRSHPHDEGVWREAGELADAMGDDVTAQRRLRHAMELEKIPAAATLAAAARVHMHAGRAAAAGGIWYKLAHREPSNASAWAGLVVCALAAGKTWLALRVRMILNDHVDAHEAQRLIAAHWPHMACGNLITRIRAGEVDLGAPEVTTEQEESQLRQLLSKAAATLSRHADAHPNRADAHYHLAVCRAELNDDDASRAAVDRALAINPRYAAAAELAERLGGEVRRAA